MRGSQTNPSVVLMIGVPHICDRCAYRRITIVLFLVVLSPLPFWAANQNSPQIEAAISEESGLYLKVELDPTVRVSHLKPGDVVAGKLSRDVYQGDRDLLPAGSVVRLTVDKLGRRARIPNDHWPWVVKAFTPRRENYPIFQSAVVSLPNGTEALFRVSSISIRNEVSIHAHLNVKGDSLLHRSASPVTQTADSNSPSSSTPLRSERSKEKAKLILTLEATALESGRLTTLGAAETSSTSHFPTGPVTLPAGTPARIILLDTVSASKSHPGDTFRARMIEPIRLDSQIVLPEGTVLEGKVVKSTPPRMLSRAGSLLLTFTGLAAPGGANRPVAASVSGVELDQRSQTRIDPEGKLGGDRPGKAWMLINLGVTAGISKEADDATQLIIEVVVSTATDASTAGVARIVGTCASGLFLLTRHGRDVVVPKFTEMTIIFDRPPSLTLSQ
jgi:hypothetical protein